MFIFLFYYQKTYQLKVIQSSDLLRKQLSLATVEETVNVAFFFDGDDGGDCRSKKFGVFLHLQPVPCLAVEYLAEFLVWISLALAKASELVQEFLWRKMEKDIVS